MASVYKLEPAEGVKALRQWLRSQRSEPNLSFPVEQSECLKLIGQA